MIPLKGNLMKLIFLFLLFIPPLSAAIFEEMDTIKLLKCSFSSRYHNRIAIDGGRIKKAIFVEQGISIRLDNETGQVFVHPMCEYPGETTISVISEEGTVQDIHLHFIDKPSEVLILKPEEPEKENFLLQIPKSQDEIVSLVLSEEIPDGYIRHEGNNKPFLFKRGIYLQQTSAFVSKEDILYLWQVENRSKQQQSLEKLCFQGGEEIYIGKKVLMPNEKTFVIILVRHEF